MKCKRAQKMLADYVNQALEAEDSLLVQEHVDKCDSCRQELDAMRKVLRVIDNARVEYPPAPIWENFLPNLHKRIEKEAALAFRRQWRQRLYILPGWAAFAASVLLILSAPVTLRYYPGALTAWLQTTESVEMAEESPASVEESSPENVLVAGIISKVLITEAEAAELRKLKSFIQPEAVTPPYYQEDDVLTYMEGELSSSEDDEELIQYLLESELIEFEENHIIESDGIEFGAM